MARVTTDPKLSWMMSRYGIVNLAGAVIRDAMNIVNEGCVFIDGIGKRGHEVNGGLCIEKEKAFNLFRQALKENGYVVTKGEQNAGCDLCKKPAEYFLCQEHMDDMRFPDVFSTVDGCYPTHQQMVLWDDGENTYIGGYEAGMWFTGDQMVDTGDSEIIWCPLPDLQYLARELRAMRRKKK